MSIQIRVPLLNTNEPEALLASLSISEGQFVQVGDILCTLETTKSTAELAAEDEGYVVGLRYAQGQSVRAGELLCYLADSPDWSPPQESAVDPGDRDAGAIPQGLRITQPALQSAREAGLDLDLLPIGPLVTEGTLKTYLAGGKGLSPTVPEADFDAGALIIYGGGGHGKSLIDLLRALNTYSLKGVLDDGIPPGETIMGVPVLGGREVLKDLYNQGVRQAVNAVGGVGDIAVRVDVFQWLAGAGFVCPAVVHPSAVVEPGASLAPGVQVFPLAYIGSEVQVGFGSIVNTSAVVSHECVLGEYSNISPGALLAGGVQVGNAALIGMGVTVNLHVSIGAGARIGNGATVKGDVPENAIVRAGAVWPE